MTSEELIFLCSATTQKHIPVYIYDCVVGLEDGRRKTLIHQCPVLGKWGEQTTLLDLTKTFSNPMQISIEYYSFVEKKNYQCEFSLKDSFFGDILSLFENKDKQQGLLLICGFSFCGKIGFWLSSNNKSCIIGSCLSVTDKRTKEYDHFQSIEELRKNFIRYDSVIGDIEKGIVDVSKLFENDMNQFTYRYLVAFENLNEDVKPELGFIEEMLYDGTHDKLHDGGLMKYHKAGKPKKLAIKWNIEKSEYSAYFWFEEVGIRTVFDKFYGAHPETETDFIIRIDTENQKYELALYRYGLKEPRVIPEDSYQLIVFKNKFEDYRSDYYNQESGAWVW